MTEQYVGSAGLPRYELTTWLDQLGAVAGVTARTDGYDLGLASPNPCGVVLERWRRLRQATGGMHGVVAARQAHGASVAVYLERFEGVLLGDQLDGHATATPGILLAVTVADCVPVYLAEPKSGALALLHAGWRGIAAGILEAGIRRLEGLSGAPARELVMHCGVSICGSCYEVGPEVVHAVEGRTADGPTPLDLRRALLGRGRAAGIRRVSASSWCTAHHPERFFSHRRSGGADGRMAAYLGRPMP